MQIKFSNKKQKCSSVFLSLLMQLLKAIEPSLTPQIRICHITVHIYDLRAFHLNGFSNPPPHSNKSFYSANVARVAFQSPPKINFNCSFTRREQKVWWERRKKHFSLENNRNLFAQQVNNISLNKFISRRKRFILPSFYYFFSFVDSRKISLWLSRVLYCLEVVEMEFFVGSMDYVVDRWFIATC